VCQHTILGVSRLCGETPTFVSTHHGFIQHFDIKCFFENNLQTVFNKTLAKFYNLQTVFNKTLAILYPLSFVSHMSKVIILSGYSAISRTGRYNNRVLQIPLCRLYNQILNRCDTKLKLYNIGRLLLNMYCIFCFN
jgi:hypothetical protein